MNAKSVINQAILEAIAESWHKNNPIATKEAVLSRLTQPHMIWAVRELLLETETEWLSKAQQMEVHDTH